MLPDLRIVIAAVVSTFILTVGVGFFASSRLIHEQMTARVDTKGLDDTPINRIALNWPEPTKADRNVDLDFAISMRGSRNPVRDITPAPAEKNKAAPQATKTETPDTISSLPAETPAPSEQTIATAPAAAPASEPIAVATQESPAPTPEAPAAPQESIAAEPEPSTSAEKKENTSDQEPSVSVANAPDPIEEKSPAPADAPQSGEASQPADAQQPKADTQVLVHLDETPAVESTGSIATPAPQISDIPLPASRPNLAMRHDAGDAASISRPVQTEPARAPAGERKRPRRTVVRSRPAPRPQPVPAQTPQLQPFDFFGLFRTTPATPRIPQVTKPTTPIS